MSLSLLRMSARSLSFLSLASAIAFVFGSPAVVLGAEAIHPTPGAVTIGKPAPAFSVITLDGKEVSLADYKGKSLIVNFWATWCGACKLEMPWLAQLRDQYASQGLEVVGIVTDGASEEAVMRIAKRYGVKYTVARCNHKTAQAYGGLPYLPESFYIGRDGKVILASADAGSKEEIEVNIRKLFGLSPK